jgi:RNA-binding protein NOB1
MASVRKPDTSNPTATQDIEQTRKSLVIDTNVFLKHQNFQSLLQEYEVFTTKSVISELRDPRAKHRAKLHYKEYKIMNPEKKHIQTVMNFAKKTGDYVSLSLADIEVVALSVQKIVENGNGDKIRKEPKKKINHVGGGNKGLVNRANIIEVIPGENK